MLRSTGELAELADDRGRDAERLLVNAPRALRRATATAAELRPAGVHDAAAGRRRGRLVRAVNDLPNCWRRPTDRRRRPGNASLGHTPDGASRGVSLHDRDARPIAKGRLGKPVEFGHKAQIVDNDDGIVLDHNVEQGNPADAPQLAPAVERVTKRTGRTPRHRHRRPRLRRSQRRRRRSPTSACSNVVIPRKGKPSQARRAEEHRRAFRRTIKWRTGSEGRISTLKRGYGWDRSRIDGTEGTRIWTGHGVLTHNLVKISALAA